MGSRETDASGFESGASWQRGSWQGCQLQASRDGFSAIAPGIALPPASLQSTASSDSLPRSQIRFAPQTYRQPGFTYFFQHQFESHPVMPVGFLAYSQGAKLHIRFPGFRGILIYNKAGCIRLCLCAGQAAIFQINSVCPIGKMTETEMT